MGSCQNLHLSMQFSTGRQQRIHWSCPTWLKLLVLMQLGFTAPGHDRIRLRHAGSAVYCVAMLNLQVASIAITVQ